MVVQRLLCGKTPGVSAWIQISGVMKRALVLFLASLTLALAKGSWPEGTKFALLDSAGQVLWTYTEGQDLTQAPPDALAQAVTLRITLADGTMADATVTVQGSGQGLGEVKVSVDRKLVPLPELLRAPGFSLKEGQLAVSRGKGLKLLNALVKV